MKRKDEFARAGLEASGTSSEEESVRPRECNQGRSP